MEQLFETKGVLSVSIGEGWLSSFEAGAMKVNDVVCSAKLAGFPATIFFNAHFLCHCEVVIFKDIFGVRVTGMEPGDDPRMEAGIKDEAIEILPFRIILGSIDISLAQLRGMSPGTFVSLGKPYSEAVDATLEVAGIPAGEGKVACINENMGIRLTKVHDNDFAEDNIRTTGNLYNGDVPITHVKNYNYKRPDKFSRNAIDRVRVIHQLFANNINTKMPALPPFDVAALDQCTLGEALEGIGADDLMYVVIHNRRHSPYPSAGENQAALLIEEEGTEHPVSDESKALLRKMVTGDGKVFDKPIFMCLSPGTEIDTDLSAVVACLRGAWKNLLDLTLEIVSLSKKEDDIRIISDNELVIAVELAHTDAPENQLVIIYPYITLEPFIRILS